MSVAPPGGQDRIMIYGPKSDGTYIIEFRMADSESLAISVPAGETRVLKHFQARITCPDMGFSPTRAAGFPHAQPSRPVFFAPQTVLRGHLWLGAVLGDCVFSISARHKLKNALMMIATIGPLELAGLAATYASTCRTRSVSVELAKHRWKAVLTG